MGGNELVTAHLLRNLDRTRFEPIVVLNCEGEFATQLRTSGVRVDIIPFRTVMLGRLVYPWVLVRLLKDARKIGEHFEHEPPDIVQCSDILALLLALRLVRQRNIPVVYSVVFFYSWLRMFAFSLVALKQVKAIVVNSGKVERDVRSRAILTGQQVVRIYPAVGEFPSRNAESGDRYRLHADLGISRETKLVCAIGRIDPMKGQMSYLRSARQILRKRSDVVFLIVGSPMNQVSMPVISGYHERLLEFQRKEKLEHAVQFLGQRSDVAEILRSVDVFVSPSRNEGFGMAIVEAYLAGLPLVLSPHAGALEVFSSHEGVFLSEPRQTDAFASSIEEALAFSSSPNVRSSLRAHRAIRSGGWKSFAEKFETLYLQIAQA
ncbi:MAG TPA: glycosyltransferase family 4 protein [Bacteroidota bacterium]|nr:glycosyltransferase family 4 protein [Bacteroidota bacterium]